MRDFGELRVGDRVLWSGCFGTEEPKEATVGAIEITEQPRSKYGQAVNSVPWALVYLNRVVVSFTNCHWAYGEQIQKIY
jgi:cell shape-determining protein MreC